VAWLPEWSGNLGGQEFTGTPPGGSCGEAVELLE